MAVNEYLNDIRRLIELNQNKADQARVLFQYQIGIDELYDHSLISERAYKTRLHSDVVRIASNASFWHETLEEKIILLPVLSEIIRLQKLHGVSNA
ncbi:hypothetical protein [Acinetobacter seifertii]|uniref:hypothetical protein n=1 Tax=Acinetobacter seifertii TaxID=1530123 RepID=UPI00190417A5|nr:hypothetical protein [Acinetobacter seifertii]MBJ9425217.1 hypothetical protein [Acinetobacter seifertii]